MSWSLADARFQFRRATGLIRRGLASLRTRGWYASWQRVVAQLDRAAPSSRLTHGLFLPTQCDTPPGAVPASDAPVASIVMPVHGQLAHTLACLHALAAHPPASPVEIIVVDDASTDATPDVLPSIEGLRYHRRASNGGFVAACNDGAAQARGDTLVFLNNDTLPQPGWLDALLDTFAEIPDAGLVGAQLRYPDGRLQEAGGIVFSDGSGWNYGRFGSPDDPRYGYLRDADYVSGAAIAIPRALFESLGGFDQRYAPAYYEDTDLAFKVRAAGRRVLYQPTSVVVHVEGATAGTDTTQGAKAYQVRNRERFATAHAAELGSRLPSGSVPSPALLHHAQHQILFIDALTPTPNHDSGSLRMVNLMRMLQKDGAHIAFFPSRRKHAGEDTLRLQSMGVECWHAPHGTSAPAWLKEHGPRFQTIVLCRHYVASEFLPLVRKHAPQARIVFDTIDLHYLRERRGAEVGSDAHLARAAERTRGLELDVIARSDVTLVVSESEQELLARDAHEARVEVVSNLHHVAGPGLPFDQRRDLVFVGGFRHPPNVDAMRWFCNDIFPLVRKQLPEIVFHCIGSHVPDSIAGLASQPGVIVHGHVEDIDPYMNGCRIAVAPLRFGAGVKGKVNLSMAHGQPVVATPIAIEGMHLEHDHDVLVAEDPRSFADAVVRLYKEQALWERLAESGMENVRQHFSLDAARVTVRRVFFDPRF